MKNFKVLFADGGCINQNTLVNGNKITDEVTLCKVIKAAWCKWTGSKNFTEWAKELNESGNYEGVFTSADALDQLCSNYHIEMDGVPVDIYKFFWTYLPLKNVASVEPTRPV